LPITSLTSQSSAILGIGAISAMLAVVIGAFGAHALRDMVTPDLLAVYHTGTQYHFYHSVGIILVGILTVILPESRVLPWAAWLMVAGIVLFSGSLYLLTLTGVRALGAITPLGGVAFIAAWATVAVAVLKRT
jgi:uncharacterized membrane protein YgdD (TMEM256/DUF423 family)